MSQLVARIMLAILMFPLGTLVYLVILLGIDEVSGYAFRYVGWLMAGGVTWLFVAIYWTLLWRKSIHWNRHRQRSTFFAIGGAAFAGFVAGVLLQEIDEGFAMFVGSTLAIILWLVATVFIWRESPEERAARLSKRSGNTLVCPTCGYNLTGLSESRCPECGTKFTIDELVASQPDRGVTQLE